MQRAQMETQLLEGCLRLAAKGLFNTAEDSLSMRIPGNMEMLLTSGNADWRKIGIADLHTVSLSCQEGLGGLHAAIYRARGDVGAVAISSPRGVRLLARRGGLLPPAFDEYVRHIGSSVQPLPAQGDSYCDMVRKAFRRGANAALLGERLLCLGMTCDRVLFNTELYEKCARAYVLAEATGNRIWLIPQWVRLIANRRLLKDERRAAASYRKGSIPEGTKAY